MSTTTQIKFVNEINFLSLKKVVLKGGNVFLFLYIYK